MYSALLCSCSAKTWMDFREFCSLKEWLRAAKAAFGCVCGFAHLPGFEAMSKNCPTSMIPWETPWFWGVREPEGRSSVRIASQAEDAGGCLGPLLWGDAGVDSRLFLGAKAAVSGAPSSWEVQSDCAELLHTKPRLPPSWGKDLSGAGALWASAVTSSHHFPRGKNT